MPPNDEIYLMGFVFFILAISIFGILWMSCELLIIKYKEYKQKEIKTLAEEIYKLISENSKQNRIYPRNPNKN